VDDWGLAPLGDRERRDVLEVIEDRYGRQATLVTSQLHVEHWHKLMAPPTFGDAILDRLVHGAHRITPERPVNASQRNDQEGNEEETANEGKKPTQHPHLGTTVRLQPN